VFIRITRRNCQRIMTLTILLAVIYGLLSAAVPANAEDAVATITIPSIDVETSIVTLHIRSFPGGEVTWDTSTITSEVGFLEGTAWFGQGGNIVLGGHSELAGRVPSVFYELDDVAVGDEIVISEGGRTWRYRVIDSYEVDFRDLSILYPTSSERLTIMTCDTDSLTTGGRYNRRVVIIAERVY